MIHKLTSVLNADLLNKVIEIAHKNIAQEFCATFFWCLFATDLLQHTQSLQICSSMHITCNLPHFFHLIKDKYIINENNYKLHGNTCKYNQQEEICPILTLIILNGIDTSSIWLIKKKNEIFLN